jgi:hypothetical protein
MKVFAEAPQLMASVPVNWPVLQCPVHMWTLRKVKVTGLRNSGVG